MKFLSKGILVTALSGSQAVMAHPGHQHIVQSSNHIAINGLLTAAVITGLVFGIRALQQRYISQ